MDLGEAVECPAVVRVEAQRLFQEGDPLRDAASRDGRLTLPRQPRPLCELRPLGVVAQGPPTFAVSLPSRGGTREGLGRVATGSSGLACPVISLPRVNPRSDGCGAVQREGATNTAQVVLHRDNSNPVTGTRLHRLRGPPAQTKENDGRGPTRQ
jgi:hypothetical protein